MVTGAQLIFILSTCSFTLALILSPSRWMQGYFSADSPGFPRVATFFFAAPIVFCAVPIVFCAVRIFFRAELVVFWDSWIVAAGYPAIDSQDWYELTACLTTFLQRALFLLIGFFTAVFSARLLILGYGGSSGAFSFAWIVLVIVLFAFGMLYGDLPSLLSRTHEAKINATGIHLVLEKEEKVEERKISLGDDTSGGQVKRRASYEFGATALAALAVSVERDTSRILTSCNKTDISQQNGCYGPDQTAANSAKASLNATRNYFRNFAAIAKCMETYATRFPSGLPIQDEMSNLAVTATDMWPAVETPDRAKEAGGDWAKEMERYRQVLEEVWKSCPRESTKQICTYDRINKNLELCNSIGYPASSADSSFIKMGRSWQSLDKTPYRALMEAYFIAAAGYPHDAAKHLEMYNVDRWHEHKSLWFEWLPSITYLLNAEQVYAYAGDYSKQFDTIKKLRGVIDKVFDYVIKESGAPRGFSKDDVDNEIVRAVRWCGDGDQEKIDDIIDKKYLQGLVYLRIAEENRLWDLELDIEAASVDEIIDAHKGLKFVFEQYKLYERCVSHSAYGKVDLDGTRVAAGNNAARLLVRAVTARQDGTDDLGGVYRDDYREALCGAKDILVRVYDQSSSRAHRPKADGEYEWEGRESRRARRLLEAIEGALGSPCHS